MVDLLQHHQMAGISLAELEPRLTTSLREGRWDPERLREMAAQYGTKVTLALADRCLATSLAAS